MELMRKWSWVLGLIGFCCFVGAGSVYYVLGVVDGRVWGFVAGGTLFLVGYAALDRESMAEQVQSRAFSYAAGSTLMQLLVAMIAVVVFVLAERKDQTWDFTEDGAYTLSENSQAVVAGLAEPVRIIGFFDAQSGYRMQAERVLRLYSEASDNVQLEWMDPLSNPREAERFGIAREGVVLVQGDRSQRLETDFTEARITQKLVLVQSAEDHIVCWTVGHGEDDPDDEMSEDGIGGVVLDLEGLNFQVLKANVATEGIDRKCEVVIVSRPRVDWLPYEREALAAYIAEGGAVMVLLDDAPVLYEVSAAAQNLAPPQTPDGFVADLERFGFRIGDDLVLDPDPRNQFVGMDDPSVIVLSGDGVVSHPVTRALGGALIFRMARSISLDEGREGISMFPLLRASADSWGETDLMSEPQPTFDVDVVGEVPLAAWAEIVDPAVLQIVQPREGSGVELSPGEGTVDLRDDLGRAVPADFNPQPGGRIVVFGDGEWANNIFAKVGSNRDLFLNTLAWLVREEDQMGERPKPAEPLDLSVAQGSALCLVSVVGMPGLTALLAILVLLRRRRL